jgi:prepilin-type N-terminal cleavage/methylation domain-containing protein
MNNRKGITLIEVIISIAIIGLLGIASLNIFDTGLKNINRAGLRTVNILEVKKEVDNQIMDITTGTENEATVILPGDSTEIFNGRLIEVTNIDGVDVEIITFVAN